jgi:hypothetical protein
VHGFEYAIHLIDTVTRLLVLPREVRECFDPVIGGHGSGRRQSDLGRIQCVAGISKSEIGTVHFRAEEAGAVFVYRFGAVSIGWHQIGQGSSRGKLFISETSRNPSDPAA